MLDASALDTDPEGMALLAGVLGSACRDRRDLKGFSLPRQAPEPVELSLLEAQIDDTLAGMDLLLAMVLPLEVLPQLGSECCA